MNISETALKNHEELFPNHQSNLAVTDPELVEQLERGLHRTYQRQEETLSVLKGRWLLGRQLREQPLVYSPSFTDIATILSTARRCGLPY